MSNKDTINRYILEENKKGNINKEMSLLILKEINQSREFQRDEIAIIGLACKFPCADNADEYWFNLKNGVEVIRNFPEKRAKEQGKGINMKAGWLESVSGFDAGFFRISPKEAISMHPTQRLFLETVWEAIEDAGYSNEGIYGSKTGVYVGIDHTYQMEYNKMTEHQDLLVMTGSMTSVLASRISYILNLHGPNLVVDTACSSGLVATHLACKALKNKECDMAVAGGINLIRQIDANFDSVESDDGILCAFDKKSKGTVWGEGVGFVILKPLEKAVKDRDNIYAVIKGSAIGNDGTTNGITAPSAETQTETILNAWEDSGLNPETISYLEAHATGTVLGDPVEVKGIKTAFEKFTKRKQFCGIGSVKPNIGHGVSAAAIASLLKVVLAMKNGQIPPNINFTEPNPFIDFSESPLYVNDKLKNWDSGDNPKRAGVSSFGFSRTNCHMVLEEAPKLPESTMNNGPFVFTLSARSENALKNYISRYCKFVKESGEIGLGDLCFTGSTGRMHYQSRLAMLVKDTGDLAEKLNILNDAKLDEIHDANIFYGEHRVVSDNMRQNLPGEITKSEKREIDKYTSEMLEQLEDLKNRSIDKELREICSMYIKGADVKWMELYKNCTYKKISLPTYPFEHKTYWIKQQTDKEVSKPEAGVRMHPLIDRCLVKTLDQEIYLTEFSVDRHWVLTEHVIMGMNVIPGITYLEMARAAAKNSCGGICAELSDVVFLAPLVVDKNETKEVHTIIRREKGLLSFKIASRSKPENTEAEETWLIHAEGTICPETKEDKGVVNLKILHDRCSKEELNVDMSSPMGGFTFGPRWRNVKRALIGDGEVLTELEIDNAFSDDTKEYVLYPSLLDNSVNLAIEKLANRVEEGLYLPISYKSLKIYKPIPPRFFSHQKINGVLEKGMQTVSMDIALIDENGGIIADIKGYVIKKVFKDAFKPSVMKKEQYHVTGWSLQDIKMKRAASGSVLLFKDENGISDQVAAKMRQEGRNVIEVSYGDGFKKFGGDSFQVSNDEAGYMDLMEGIKSKNITQIVHMMSIVPESEVDSVEAIEDRKNRSLYSMFYLVRSLIANKMAKDLDILLVSDYVNEVTGEETRINPHNAPLFAIGKVARNEHEGLSCRSMDIDVKTTASDIINEIYSETLDYMIAYREGKRYVEEFSEIAVETVPASGTEIRDDGVYLITGGTGGIGLEVAKHLASKARVNIAFVNRSSLPGRDDWKEILERNDDKKLCGKLKSIIEIENTGSKVVCCSADVTSYSDLKVVIDELRTEFGRINGVIHSAGIAGEGLIIRKDEARFREVIAPKVEGTWILDRLTRQDKPDFFIMFSSILSFAGVMGQADYAAANSYMDSYAAYRNKTAGKTAAVNWSVWNETGMAQDYNMDEVRGLYKTVTNDMGMEAFENILNKDITRLVVGELDYGRIALNEGGLGINLSKELKEKVLRKCEVIKAKNSALNRNQPQKVVISNVAGASGVETQIAQIWSEVMALEEVNLFDSFSELGGDSIMAASLMKAINKVFPGAMDISDIFTYPTIKLMAEQVGKRLGIDPAQDGKSDTSSEISRDSESEIEEIMNRLARGEISTSEADELIEIHSGSGK